MLGIWYQCCAVWKEILEAVAVWYDMYLANLQATEELPVQVCQAGLNVDVDTPKRQPRVTCLSLSLVLPLIHTTHTPESREGFTPTADWTGSVLSLSFSPSPLSHSLSSLQLSTSHCSHHLSTPSLSYFLSPRLNWNTVVCVCLAYLFIFLFKKMFYFNWKFTWLSSLCSSIITLRPMKTIQNTWCNRNKDNWGDDEAFIRPQQ